MARPSRPRPGRSGAPGRPAPPSVPAPRPPYEPLADALARPRSGRYVEQFSWYWHGPLDVERFTAAWQSVTDREAVLRAAVAGGARPRIVFHERARADVVRHPPGSVDWDVLLERDRLRGFDLRRPGPLRVTLVDLVDLAAGPGPVPATARVLVTFHHGLLDTWSAHVLLGEFCRAYLGGGVLPGGERRPDLRDWAEWLTRQDTAPARDFWARAIPAGALAVLPAVPGPAARERGCGRAEVRLSAADAGRLHRWAAALAVPDSSALQAVWALLLYRAAGTAGPAPVGFGVTVSGRGIALDSVGRLLGPMRACLPMAVLVDPARRVDHLLTALRDRALDMAAYEWVAAGQIHEWTGRAPGDLLLESLVAMEGTPYPPVHVRPGLAAAGIRFEPLRTSGAHTALPVALLAHRGHDNSLTLVAVHDRARLPDAEAARLVGHCARLLRHLPVAAEAATVADVLAVLGGEAPPRATHGRVASRFRPYSTGGRPIADSGTSES
jgi:Condensation domain